jgi:hypothetical protein
VESNYATTFNYLKKLKELGLVISDKGRSKKGKVEMNFKSNVSDFRLFMSPAQNCIEVYILTSTDEFHKKI